eukprot:5519142-Alexandrium_andersonii.AAC.1
MARAAATRRRSASSPCSTPGCVADAVRGGSGPLRCSAALSAASQHALNAAAGHRVGVQQAASGPPDPRRGEE